VAEHIPVINKNFSAFRNPRIFLTNRGSVMDNILPYFFTTGIKKADIAVMFQDVVGDGLKYATEIRSRGIPLIVVQHGRGAVRDYLPPKNLPLLADKLCVWGTRDHEMMLEAGFSKDRIALTGCPIFDGLSKTKKPHKGINILFTPSHSEESKGNEDVLKMLRSIKGINILSKILRVHDHRIYGKNAIVSRSFDPDHMKKCLKAVRMADILVSNEPGTIELIAMYLEVPVIFVGNIDTYKNDPLRGKGAYTIESVADLPSAIEKTLREPDLTAGERKKELLASAGVGLPGSPVQKIVNLIKEMAK